MYYIAKYSCPENIVSYVNFPSCVENCHILIFTGFDTKLATGYRVVVTVNMADDDLEYYIKFPSPSPKDSTPTSETEEFVFVYDEDKLPVVMLLGWAGCQDKYLSKYSAIYEERG
jgi:hypothetical protein